MAEIEKKWYVLRAISGKEAKVKEYLEADLKNSELGEYVSQVLIPTEKVYQVRNGKKIVKEDVYKRQIQYGRSHSYECIIFNSCSMNGHIMSYRNMITDFNG